MRRALCDSLPKNSGQSIELPEGEAKHLVSVLRMRGDDEVELLDGNGFYCRGKLWHQGKRLMVEAISSPQTNPALLSKPIHLSMAMIKNEAMEWTIEKAVELGVRSFTAVETEFTVIKIKSKGEDVFRDRYQKIADQALKQCGRLDRLVIHPPVSFENALLNKNHLIWLDETLAVNSPQESHLAHFLASHPSHASHFELLVGPEGGFSAFEKQRLQQSRKGEITRVHLGPIILRAETAALFGISLLTSISSDISNIERDHDGTRKNKF